MFFVLSKTVGFMLLPTNLLIGVGFVGAILLLFEVGVESDLMQLLAVGWSALLVATGGRSSVLP